MAGSDNDFYAQLVTVIKAAEFDRSTLLITGLASKQVQHAVLVRLAREIADGLLADAVESTVVSDVTELVGSLELAEALSNARARAVSAALDEALTDACFFALTDSQVRAQELMDRLAGSPHRTTARLFAQAILQGMKPLLENPPAAIPVTELPPTERSHDTFEFSLTGIKKLTPSTLVNSVTPVMQAFIDLQAALALLHDVPVVDPQIVTITAGLPVTVRLADVMPLMVEFYQKAVLPWRRQNPLVITGTASTIELTQAKHDLVENLSGLLDQIFPELSIASRFDLIKPLECLATSPIECQIR